MSYLDSLYDSTPGARKYGPTLGAQGANFDLAKRPFRRSLFGPTRTLANLYQSNEAQDYLNPEALWEAHGIQGLLGGRNSAQNMGAEMAAGAGLGPGFAAGLAQEAQQNTAGDLAAGGLQARMMGQGRRMGAATTMAQSVMSGQQAVAARNAQRRARGAGGLMGGGAGALVGAGVGTLIAPGIGTAIGAGMGGGMGSSMGSAVDAFHGRFSPQVDFSALMTGPLMMSEMGMLGGAEGVPQQPGQGQGYNTPGMFGTINPSSLSQWLTQGPPSNMHGPGRGNMPQGMN